MNAEDSDIILPQSEVIQIVRLLGDIAGMDSPLPDRKRALMDCMNDLLESDGWLWTATRLIDEEPHPISVGFIHGGLSEKQLMGIAEASEIAPQQPPEDAPLTDLCCRGEHFTRTREQVVPDEVWYSHPTTKQYRLDRGLDHFLYSIYPLGPAHASSVGFFRRAGREPFTDLQRRLCHIVFANVRWLHEASFPDHGGLECTALTPRLRTILLCLLDGKQKDEIAKLLHISPNTVKTHIRHLYRHFSVNSQTELMRHFQTGNGNDIAPAKNHPAG